MDKHGLVNLNVAEDGMGSIGGASGYRVPSVSLDDLLRDGVIASPDLIKMDVEGAETMVLSGARELLAKCRPIIFLACHGEVQRQNCSRRLREFGYRIFDLSGNEQKGNLDIDEVYAVPGRP